MPPSLDEPVRQLVRRHLAVLGERGAAFRREALDPGLDRDASGSAQQSQHVRFPQIDSSLNAERQAAGYQSFEQLSVGQEDFVDEVDVFGSLIAEPIDFLQKNIGRPPAVQIAEILLGAEGAAIGTAAGCLDLGAGADGFGFEAMMVVMVPPDHLVGPGEHGLILEAGGLRPAIDTDRFILRETQSGKIALAIGKAQQRLFALAHDDDIDHELLQRGPRRRRSMRPDGNEHRCEIAHSQCQRLRHAQFGRRAAPEQIGRRRREHDHVGPKGAEFGFEIGKGEVEHMRVKQQCRMSGLLQIVPADPELERQMRRTAAEIDAAVEAPVGIDQRDTSHARASRLEASIKRLASHWCSETKPSCSDVFGCQPSAA